MIKLQFGLRQPRTEGKQIVVEKTFGDGETIEVDDADYENLVYIATSTGFASSKPVVIVTDKLNAVGENFVFLKKYYNFTDDYDNCK